MVYNTLCCLNTLYYTDMIDFTACCNSQPEQQHVMALTDTPHALMAKSQ